MDYMKPIYREDIPLGEEWIYEVKYDGFRAFLSVDEQEVLCTSKNGNLLNKQFPELISYCEQLRDQLKPFLPFRLDGELVILNTSMQTNFSLLQTRGRSSSLRTISKYASEHPATFMAFDLLILRGESLQKQPLKQRKEKLDKLLQVFRGLGSRMKQSTVYHDAEHLQQEIVLHQGEGIVAKKKNSSYQSGKRHSDWYKIKNWRTVTGFITEYDSENGYYQAEVYASEKREKLGKCKHGLSEQENDVMTAFMKENGKKQKNRYLMPPAICAEIHTLGMGKDDFREPLFRRIAPELAPEACTKEKVQMDLAAFPQEVELAKLEKLYWETAGITKREFLIYMRTVAPYLLPRLKNRALTVIRCPDGIEHDFFYQKNIPDYAPAFMESADKEELHCQNLASLIWLANHGSIEYHIPFHLTDNLFPTDIAIDLDPPAKDALPLAVQAALLLKKWFDEMELNVFIKTSGSKGLQLYLPLPENQITFQEAEKFTEAIARLLEQQHPDLFTTERLKKKRKERLYIDYVQFGKGKTLPAPYSPRKLPGATVSAPLYWEEVREDLKMEDYTIRSVPERLQQKGCPFADYEAARDSQNITYMKQLL